MLEKNRINHFKKAFFNSLKKLGSLKRKLWEGGQER